MASSVVPSNKLQQKLRQGEHETQRPDPWTTNTARGIITAVYDRYTREEEGAPDAAAARLAQSPGLIIARIMLLGGKVVYLPLGISPDERHALYGNNANMQGRPVEIEYRDQDISSGKVYLYADNLNLGIREDEVSEPFDIAMAVA